MVRQWVDIDPDMEFRGFVVDGTLTALSQYHHLVFFPRIQRVHSQIADAVRSFFAEEVSGRLASAYPRYIIDFGLVWPASGAAPQIHVIELNPFYSTTDRHGMASHARVVS